MLTVVDFQKQSYDGIRHGGPSSKYSPKQSLMVDTDQIPDHCHYLFFTLSGFMPGGVSLAIFQESGRVKRRVSGLNSNLALNGSPLSSQNPSVHLKNGMTSEVLASYTADRCRNGEAGCTALSGSS